MTGPILQSAQPAGLFAGAGAVALGVVALGLLAAAVVLLLQAVRARQRIEQETREIVQVIEDLRSGKARKVELGAGSPLGSLSDAVHRLGHELHGRWSEAEAASERWRALIDASEDIAVITTDTDGDIRSFSTGASRLFGWDADEVLSRPAAVIFDESSYKDLLPMLARRTLRKKGITTHSRLLRRDGGNFEAEVAVRLLTGSSSQPVGFMMVVRDITEQQRLESDLRESQERYRTLVEGLGEGVVIVKDGRMAYANSAVEALTDRPLKELVGLRWRDVVATTDVLVIEEALDSLVGASGTRTELRCSLVGRDGAARAEVKLLASAVEYDSGPAVLLLVQDETLERRVQGELHRNELRLDAVLEATSDGILVISNQIEGRIVQMTNRAFADLFGLRVDDYLGRDVDFLLDLLRAHGEGGVEVARQIAANQATRQRIGLTGKPGEDAAPRELHLTVARLSGRAGEGLGRIVACRDVTEQRRSEQQLQEQAERLQLSKVELEQSYSRLNEVNDKLEQRGEDLDRLNQELRRLDEMKSNLLGNVSHELQTPLVSIRGYTEMILKERLGPISEEQRKGLQLSLKNIDRLISMIDNLLAFTRPDAEAERLTLSRFELKPLLEEVIELLRQKISSKGVQVSAVLGDERLAIHGDRDKVLQVFLNLLSNAVKFNRDDGTVEISALPGRSGYATIRVRDTGVGIPQESVARVFDRHYRAGNPDGRPGRSEEGAGIGLAIVRDILREHGCTIQVESEEGRGTEFTFTLPMVRNGSVRGPDREPPAEVSPADLVEEIPEFPPVPPVPEVPEVPEIPEIDAAPAPDADPTPESTPPSDRPRLRIIRRFNRDS